MKKLTSVLLLLLPVYTAFCQDKLADHLKDFEGVWIAEDFLRSFELTKSAVGSVNAFDPDEPGELTINLADLENGILPIGYSILHEGHLFFPDGERHYVAGGDTVHNQPDFRINVNKSDSLKYHKTSTIYDFSYQCISYLTWTFKPDTFLILYRPAQGDVAEKTIKYKQVSDSFDKDYTHPSPLYYYIRSKTLAGTYILKDSLNKVVCSDFRIGANGKATGYAPWEGKIFFFSTDLYCGPQPTYDLVLACSFSEWHQSHDCLLFTYKRLNDKTIQFHRSETHGELRPDPEANGRLKPFEVEVSSKMMYELVRK